MNDLLVVLLQVVRGEATADEELVPMLYDELRRLAQARMAADPAASNLEPGSLVQEIWLRLVGDVHPKPAIGTIFFAAAAESVRRLLVERVRRRDGASLGAGESAGDLNLLKMHEALERFQVLDPQKADLVKLRYFGGVTIEDAARYLEVSEGTAKRWWAYARAWLYREMKKS